VSVDLVDSGDSDSVVVVPVSDLDSVVSASVDSVDAQVVVVSKYLKWVNILSQPHYLNLIIFSSLINCKYKK